MRYIIKIIFLEKSKVVFIHLSSHVACIVNLASPHNMTLLYKITVIIISLQGKLGSGLSICRMNRAPTLTSSVKCTSPPRALSPSLSWVARKMKRKKQRNRRSGGNSARHEAVWDYGQNSIVPVTFHETLFSITQLYLGRFNENCSFLAGSA